MKWTESWFGDSKASEWTYLASRLRCAAKLGGDDMQFGGYITPRGPTGGVAHGTVGLLKQAISMVGSGAKGLDWFEFGPEDFFPGNWWSAIGMHEVTTKARTHHSSPGGGASPSISRPRARPRSMEVSERLLVI